MSKPSELTLDAGVTAPPAPAGAFVTIAAPARLWIPCAGEAKPAGTRVRRGDSLAADGTGAPSPVGGTIVGPSRARSLGGQEIPAVLVETDAKASSQSAVESTSLGQALLVLAGLRNEDSTTASARLLAAGIDADRWTSPRLAEQLREPPRRPITTVLCGALDLDPVLPLQRELVAARAVEIATGVMALAAITGAPRGILALPEDASSDLVTVSRQVAAGTGLRLFPLPDEYPTAHPSLLIHRVLNGRLPPDRLPTEAGVLFLDAPAALAVGQFFLTGAPPLEVPLGVYERGRAKAHLAWVPVGSRLRDVMEALGITTSSLDLRVGHLLRDLPADTDAIIASAELTVLAAESHARPPAAACLRCAWCVEACPVQIHPAGLLEAAQQQDPELADRYGLQSCIECGICSYVCPSRLPLLPAIRTMIAERGPRK